MENKSEKILKILEEKAPTTGKEIAKEASIPYSTCVRLLSNLCDEEKVAKIYSSSGRIYYLLNKQATIRDVSNMHIEIISCLPYKIFGNYLTPTIFSQAVLNELASQCNI